MPPKRRRRFHGLYYHSSPPKVLPMNGNSNSSKTSGRDESREAFVVKPSNIRIWIHDKDVGKLTRVLWAGHGNRLRQETSTSPRVKKFLETVPYVLNIIKDVHQAVVDNNLDLLKSKTEPPVPPSLITTKDSNGLTVMHKAAGLAHTRIVEHLLKVWPGGATDIDATGKTPLHWAASAKNNTRCYNLLVQAGADEEALDYRMKTASHYKSKPHDIDRSWLTIVPEAPRVPIESHTDWSALVDEVGKLTDSQTDLSTTNENNNQVDNKEDDHEDLIGGNGINLLTTRSKANTIDNTSEPDDIGDEQNNLTIEEQAIKDAIEDERIFEQEQSEKEAQQKDQDPELENDVNGNDEPLGSPAISPPPTTTADEVEEQAAKINGEIEIPKETEDPQNIDEKKTEESPVEETTSDDAANTKENTTLNNAEETPTAADKADENAKPISTDAPKVVEVAPVAEAPSSPQKAAINEAPKSAGASKSPPSSPEVPILNEAPKSASSSKSPLPQSSSVEPNLEVKDESKHEHEIATKQEEEKEVKSEVHEPKFENEKKEVEEPEDDLLKTAGKPDENEVIKRSPEPVRNGENHVSNETKKTEKPEKPENDNDSTSKTPVENKNEDPKLINGDKNDIETTNQNDPEIVNKDTLKTTDQEKVEDHESQNDEENKTPVNGSRNMSASSTHSKTPNGTLTPDGSHPPSNKSSAASQRARSGSQTPNKAATPNGDDKEKHSDEGSDKEDAKVQSGTL